MVNSLFSAQNAAGDAVTRQKLQDDAVATLLSQKRLMVNWGTGVGKSRVAIRSIEGVVRRGGRRLLLLVAGTAHKGNWQREFIEALGQERGGKLFSMCTVECYESLPKYADTQWDIIVADEAHHLRSENRTGVIATMEAEYFLCLSATMSCNGDADILLQTLDMKFGLFATRDFGIDDAIKAGILHVPDIYVHVLPLEDITCQVDIQESWGPSARRVDMECFYDEAKDISSDRERYPAVNLTVHCTPLQANAYYTARQARAKEKWLKARSAEGLRAGEKDNAKTAYLYNNMVHIGNQRKVMIGKSKTMFAQWLLGELGQDRYICFCADVDQAVTLGGDDAIYSDRRDNLDVIDGFNAKRRNRILAVNMIKEGANLKDIHSGVIVQLGGKERDFIQKFGRTMRSKTPSQHIIIVNGTRDIDYFRSNIAGVDPRYIHYIPYGSLRKGTGEHVRASAMTGPS